MGNGTPGPPHPGIFCRAAQERPKQGRGAAVTSTPPMPELNTRTFRKTTAVSASATPERPGDDLPEKVEVREKEIPGKSRSKTPFPASPLRYICAGEVTNLGPPTRFYCFTVEDLDLPLNF